MALEAQNITINVGSKTIVNSASLSIESGYITVLVGPNGAGKSTLLGGLSGHSALSGGRAIIAGTDLAQLTPAQLCNQRAVMLQSDNIVFDFTVDDVIRMGLVWQFEESAIEQSDVIYDLASKCEIEHLLSRSILTLSGGEKQRVHFCRCLVQVLGKHGSDTPKYLLLDEPTSSQDIANELRVLKLLKEMAAQREIGVFLIVHDLNLAAHFGDVFYIMKNGRLVANGERDAVMTEDILSSVYETSVKTELTDSRLRIHTF
jgi:iron complex transport system ATP-binding protein